MVGSENLIRPIQQELALIMVILKDLSSVQNYGVKFRIYRYRIVDLSSVQKYGMKFRIYRGSRSLLCSEVWSDILNLPHDFGHRIVDVSSVQEYGVKF